MSGHVNELCCSPRPTQRPFHHCLRTTKKGVHRAIGGQAWVHVNQVAPIRGCDRIGYGFNHLNTQNIKRSDIVERTTVARKDKLCVIGTGAWVNPTDLVPKGYGLTHEIQICRVHIQKWLTQQSIPYHRGHLTWHWCSKHYECMPRGG